jgi:hypothetical protein
MSRKREKEKDMSATLTPQDVLNEVVRLGRELPDFKYTRSSPDPLDGQVVVFAGQDGFSDNESSCSYLPDERNPMGCIIGAALTNLGLLDPDTFKLEGDSAEDVVSELLGLTPSAYDAKIGNALANIQGRQDQGASWGNAVRDYA